MREVLFMSDQKNWAASFNSRFAAFLKNVTRDADILRLTLIMVGSFALMASLRPSLFLTLNNFKSMTFQLPEIGIYTIAVMLAMLLGGIDLSVVGIGNISGILAAFTIIKLTPIVGTWPAILIGVATALAVGAACGFFNGFLIAKLGIPAMLATLGTMEIYSGLGIILTKGAAVFGMPEEFAIIGTGTTLGIPNPLIIFVIVVAVFTVMLQRMKFGLELYLLGTNPKAARFSGIKNAATIIKTHVFGGLLAATAGIILASRANSAKADYASSYTLQCILVAILGGVSPFGGFGKVTGVVISMLTLQFLSSGFNMLRFDNYQKSFIWGTVLILAMIMNYYGNKRAEKSKTNAADMVHIEAKK